MSKVLTEFEERLCRAFRENRDYPTWAALVAIIDRVVALVPESEDGDRADEEVYPPEAPSRRALESDLATLLAEREGLRLELKGEREGNLALRRAHGAREDETFPGFVARLSREKSAAELAVSVAIAEREKWRHDYVLLDAERKVVIRYLAEMGAQLLRTRTILSAAQWVWTNPLKEAIKGDGSQKGGVKG